MNTRFPQSCKSRGMSLRPRAAGRAIERESTAVSRRLSRGGPRQAATPLEDARYKSGRLKSSFRVLKRAGSLAPASCRCVLGVTTIAGRCTRVLAQSACYLPFGGVLDKTAVELGCFLEFSCGTIKSRIHEKFDSSNRPHNSKVLARKIASRKKR